MLAPAMTTAGGIKKKVKRNKITRKKKKNREHKCGEINTIKSSQETSRLEEVLTEEEGGDVLSAALEVPS